MRLNPLIAGGIACFALWGCTESTEPPTNSATATPAFDVSAAPSGEEHGEWLLHGLSAGEQRYSPLKQINDQNVQEIGLAFEFNDFEVRGRTHRGMEATVLMDDGVLYFTGPWSVLYAVDARTGEKMWVHDPKVPGAQGRKACCDAINRGAALKGDLLYVGTLDGYLIAVDKKTGEERWRADTLIERDASYTITGAPRIAGDLIIIGNGGAEFGVRGYVTAYNAKTGEEAWRFYTVPSANPDETIDITEARKTWSDGMDWDYGGGGTVWDSMVFDKELNTLYIGVGNGSPWPVWARGGNLRDTDNLYLSSIVALDATTGMAKWHYQTTPADSWDYTATQHIILADIEWEGEIRKVLMQAPKNGFFYVVDRVTGELLSAKNYTTVTWASGVDMKTGRPILTENSDYSEKTRIITPSQGGGHNWHPMSYSPDTDMVYIPVSELSAKFMNYEDGRGYLPASRNTKVNATIPGPSPENLKLLEGLPPMKFNTSVVAWDPQDAEIKWTTESILLPSGLLTTGGNLLVSGSSFGHLNFFNAETGELVHKIDTGTVIMAAPMTYELDGEQYIAVVAGNGGVFLFNQLPGMASGKYKNSERLLVYKLGGGKTPLPEPVPPVIAQPIPEGLPTDEATLAQGKDRFERHCVMCHAPGNRPTGVPNLWNLSPGVDQAFDSIVLGGAFEAFGMASFADVLDENDTLAIRAYIAHDRRRLLTEKDSGEIHFH